MLALRLPPEIEQRLDALAKKTGRSKSYYAREAILRQIEDIEAITWRAGVLDAADAPDARKPGARPQEAHQTLMAAPAWRVEFDRAAARELRKLGVDAERRVLALSARAHRRQRRTRAVSATR